MPVSLRTRALALTLVLAAAGLAPAHAGLNRWTPFGPEGGGLTALAVDPRDGDVLYAVSAGRVVKSRDGGESWRPSGAGIGEELAVTLLAIDPAAPERLYAIVRANAGHGGVFRSDDGGAHWQAVIGGREFAFSHSLTVLLDGTVLAGTSQAIWRSVNFGLSWTAVVSSTSADQFHSLAWSPLAPLTVYAGALAYRLKSEDGGATWTRLYEEPHAHQPFVNALAVAPSDPDRVYETGGFGLSGGTLRSRDGGATWEGPFRFGGDRLLVDPRDPDTVYAGNLRGLFVSRDGGENFHLARRGVPPLDLDQTFFYGVAALAATPAGEILAATPQGLLRSADAGYHWHRAAMRGLRGNPITFLRLDPHAPEHYLLRSFEEFFATHDGGRTFLPTAAALPVGRRLVALELDPFTPDRLLAVTWGRQEQTRFELLESRNAGATWRQIGSPPPTDLVDLLFVSRHVLLTAAGNTIWRSENGGGRWRPVLEVDCRCDGSARFRRLVADPSHPATFYALADVPVGHSALPSRVYRSLDAGRHWTLWAEGYQALALDPNDPRSVYLATIRTIVRTRDGGRSFETRGTLQMPDIVRELVADRERSGVLYVTTYSSGVWRSADAGRTWARLPGLPNRDRVNVPELAQELLPPWRLLAAPASGGLWRGNFEVP